MKVVKTHIVARWAQNGPESFKELIKVEECMEIRHNGPEKVFIEVSEGKSTYYKPMSEETFRKLEKNSLLDEVKEGV